MRGLCLALVLMVTACSGAQTHQSSAAPPSPLATPTAITSSPAGPAPATPGHKAATPVPIPSFPAHVSPTLLFAALEARGMANPRQWNTVVIASLDGQVHSQATFTPLPWPYTGCGLAVLPPSAYVVAGRVFFADGTGAIRSLGPGGVPTPVTSVPLSSSQQIMSFAVSPDGASVLATIVTLPSMAANAQPCLPGSPVFAPGDFTYDLYSATAGGAARLLSHQSFATAHNTAVPSLDAMELWGWNRVGPYGTYPSALDTMGDGPARYFGEPYSVDPATGKPVAPIATGQCIVFDIAASGDFACQDQSGMSVRRPDNSQLWHTPNGVLAFLSPDEKRLAAWGSNLESIVVGQDGTLLTLPPQFDQEGWLDSTTVVGGGRGTELTYATLGAPGTAVDLGIKGEFIAAVRP